jgi:ribosomal protein L11 methyltransferase
VAVVAYGPGVRHIVVTVGPGDVDLVSGLAWLAGAHGVEERGDSGGVDLVVALDDPTAFLHELRGVGDRWPRREVTLDADEWVESWKPWARAVELDGLTVRPPWLDAPGAGIDVVIDPGRAWGHGAHPTTRLILDALVADPPAGRSVLEVGCGSGVLSITAAVLGAARVVAVDVDPEAVTATAVNAAANGVAVEVSDRAVGALTERFDLVLANIDAPVLSALGADIAARVAGCGTALVSGLLAGRAEEVVVAFAPLRVVDRWMIDDWVGFRLAP